MSDRKVVLINERIPSIKDQRKQRANRRLLFFLSFFFILLLLIIYFQSPLSHVKTIFVTGNEFVSNEEIIEISELNNETNMWNVDRDEVIERILAHREIKSAELIRHFPNTVEIIVEEYTRIAYLYQEDSYFPILETGDRLKQLPKEQLPADAPILINFKEGELLAEFAAELSKVPTYMIERISEVFYEPTSADPLAIVLYMNDGFVVHSSINEFSTKIAPYPSIVNQLDPDVEGILHMRMSPYFEQFHVEEEESIESEG